MENILSSNVQKLNLGCGQFRKEGYVNLDVSPLAMADVIHDLEVFPYPFAEHTFELIEADHILEHLSHPFRVMAELHRITKPGGQIRISVPHFSRGFTHPEHQRGFDATFPFYFQDDYFGGYTGLRLHHKKTTFRWVAQQSLLKRHVRPATYYLLQLLGAIINTLANLAPFFCSRIWCFWVGGFNEIEFVFEKPEKIEDF
jgi:SAM-dependent methyltransferase